MQAASAPEAFERALGAILARVSVSDTIAVAYSGGLDSSVLLHLVRTRAAALGMRLLAFHIHHGLSPNADRWLRHGEQECARLGVALHARHISIAPGGSGVEQAARSGRYAALGELCRAHHVRLLLTAHHLDDQAETVLLQLLRGSGVAGLSGMDEVNAAPGLLGDGDILLARPLLTVTRETLEEFARAQGIAYVEDESNSDLRYARNALRHGVMPALARHFPGCQTRLARSARHAQSAQRLLDELAAQDLAACREEQGIALDRLARLSADRANNLLRYWFASHALRMPSTAWLEQMRAQLLAAREDAQLRVVHPDCEIRRHRGRMVLTPRRDDAAPRAAPVRFCWQGEERIRFPAYGGSLHFEAVLRDDERAWLAAQDLQLCYRSGGESLKPAVNRPTRSLKHHYQALGIPAWERQRLPLVLAGDHLLYAAGIGMNFNVLPQDAGLRLRWQRETG